MPHQHRGHPRPCRLRRRGGADPVDGRLGAAGGGCGGRPDAADALRDEQGVRGRPEPDPRRQQDRSRQRPPPPGGRRGVRPVRPPRRDRPAARLPGRVRIRHAGRRRTEPRAPRERHDAAARSRRRTGPAAGCGHPRPVPDAGQHPRLFELRRRHRHRPGQARRDGAPRCGGGGERGRAGAQGPRRVGARKPRPRARRAARGAGGRHRVHHRRRRRGRLRHALRRGRGAGAAAAQCRRAHADDGVSRQHFAVRRTREPVPDEPAAPGAPVSRGVPQRGAAGGGDPRSGTGSRSRAGESCTCRC